jgi:hypothetical protein
MLLDKFPPMTGATSPNRVGVVDGGKDQHGRASRGGVGGNGALPVGQSNAHYITKLPKAEHDAKEWQAAMEALLLVAERDGDRVRLVTRVGYNWTDHPLISAAARKLKAPFFVISGVARPDGQP